MTPFLLLFPLTYFSVKIFESSPRNLLEAFYLNKKKKKSQKRRLREHLIVHSGRQFLFNFF